MKSTPILFSGPMVRAILDDRKTQTRRLVKPQPPSHFIHLERRTNLLRAWANDGLPHHAWKEQRCPYGQPGDHLWVRETTCIAPKRWATPDDTCVKDYDGDLRYVSYKADGHSEEAMRDYKLKWTPSIHVPRWASRITLEVTGVRVERLPDISEADAIAEGIERVNQLGVLRCSGWADYSFQRNGFMSPIASYRSLWESINGPGSWTTAWAWVIEFKRLPAESTPPAPPSSRRKRPS